MNPSSLSRLALAVCLFTQAATASPLYYAATDNYYDVVFTSLTWTDARTAAASSSYLGRSGRLATVTSIDENDFVVNNFLAPGSFGLTAWIGGYQPAGDVGGPAG